VIPQFESLFKGFGADLPAFTQMVSQSVEVYAAPGWIVGLLLGRHLRIMHFHKRSRNMPVP